MPKNKVFGQAGGFIYLFDTMAVWFDQSAGSNREENGKAEINPCFIAYE